MPERASEQEKSSAELAAEPRSFSASGPPEVARIRMLQRFAGNRAVGRMLAARPPPPTRRTLARMELWRGQAVGVLPQAGDTHDLGPGLYLATTEELGRKYVATRVLIPEPGGRVSRPERGQLLYIDVAPETLGRVLDLTSDPRWHAFMNGREFPDDKETRVQLVKRNYQYAYEPLFMQFLAENGMKLDDYDTVMAPEYLRGDVQVCVRNPKIMEQLRPDLNIIASGAAAMPLPKSGRTSGGASGAAGATRLGPVADVDAPVPNKPKGGGGKGGAGGGGPASGAPPAVDGGGPPGTPPASSAAAPDDLRAMTGTPDDMPIVASELSARGLARADAHGLLLDMTNAILNRINDEVQKRRTEEQLRALESQVEEIQRERPDCGVLLIPIFRQIQTDGFSAIRPGPALTRVEIGVGRDQREADLDRLSQHADPPEWFWERDSGVPPVWIPAPRPQGAAPPAPPWPAVGLATFSSRSPTLTTVIWSALPTLGFNDVAETTLDVPAGVEPRFQVLELPAEITAWDRNPRGAQEHTAQIPQEMHAAGPAARLDVYVPFDNDVAVAIFPADAATVELFRSAPEMINWGGLVPHRTSYSLIRWASPDQIERLDD